MTMVHPTPLHKRAYFNEGKVFQGVGNNDCRSWSLVIIGALYRLRDSHNAASGSILPCRLKTRCSSELLE